MVPFIDLFYGVTSISQELLSINRIIIWPTVSEREKVRRIHAVKMLIDRCGINAKVTASEIPYVEPTKKV